MGIRGEPGRPADPPKGLVWSSIVELLDEPGSSSEYVSVVDLERARLAKHPWSIGGGGAAELKESIDRGANFTLQVAIEPPIGRSVRVGADEAFLARAVQLRRSAADAGDFRPLVIGEEVRDWSNIPTEYIWYPYGPGVEESAFLRELWPLRVALAGRATFQGVMADAGLQWWKYMQHTPSAYDTELSIVFAFIATHNHFVLDCGGKVFNRSAPVIKLPPGADERRHLGLLGMLNSSTACFWMKQVFHDRGVGGIGGGIGDEKWEPRYEYDATKLQAFPLPANLDPTTATLLDRLASDMASFSPAAFAETRTPSSRKLTDADRRYRDLRAQMIAAQERLDWEVYRRYELIDEALTTSDEAEPPLQLGERAFEIVLARRMAAGEEESSWFARHGSTPITELPAHWPEPYKRLVERRIEVIEADRNIGLIERAEHKRRWLAKPWQRQVEEALKAWLLNRLESPRYWPEPAALTSSARLAAEARTDPDFVQVAQLHTGREDVDIAALVAELVKAEAVPYLAALRYSESGMRKYAQWLETWELQRREDAGEDVGAIPVPPKYVKVDFQGVAWNHRGKLDVPKERFISYPGAERETDASLVVGWAGWDHLARARALATWYLQARRDGRDREHLRPLLAGLAELVPWLRQWHDGPNPDPALDRPGSQIAALMDAEMRALHLTADDLAGWRPAPTRRGRARR